MIKPTVGRVVWYRPGEHDGMPQGHDKQPLAAIVTYVHSDRLVNLAIFDANGNRHRKTSVTLLQDGEAQNAPYAEWMPYQKGQAAKTELAETIARQGQTSALPKGTSASESAIEAEIRTKGLNAPRVTPADIDTTIVSEDYHVFPNTTLTVCALHLRNGFVVTGTSAAASPENFDQAIGRRIARDNARNQIWALEGYLLKQRLTMGV